MKKVDIDKLISKMMIITVAVLTIMFCLWLVNVGYQRINFAYFTMIPLMLVISIIFAVLTVTFIVTGFLKSQKFFEISAWCGGLSVLTVLLKINYEIKALQFTLWGRTIMFYPALIKLSVTVLIAGWIYTIYRIVKK